MKINKKLLIFVLAVVILMIIVALYQFLNLKKAHSSFENYFSFRGCVQLLEKTDISATCKTSSGQTIKIVEINNKWYLDGDGPGIW